MRLFDPLEMDLPDIGLVTMKDAETGEQLVVDTHNQRLPRALRGRRRAARDGAARGARARRRRHPRARHRRRPGRRHPALRRPEEAAQPARQLERRRRTARSPTCAGARPREPEARDERCDALDDLPLADDAVGACSRCRCSSRSTCCLITRRKKTTPALRQPRPGQGGARQRAAPGAATCRRCCCSSPWRRCCSPRRGRRR